MEKSHYYNLKYTLIYLNIRLLGYIVPLFLINNCKTRQNIHVSHYFLGDSHEWIIRQQTHAIAYTRHSFSWSIDTGLYGSPWVFTLAGLGDYYNLCHMAPLPMAETSTERPSQSQCNRYDGDYCRRDFTDPLLACRHATKRNQSRLSKLGRQPYSRPLSTAWFYTQTTLAWQLFTRITESVEPWQNRVGLTTCWLGQTMAGWLCQVFGRYRSQCNEAGCYLGHRIFLFSWRQRNH